LGKIFNALEKYLKETPGVQSVEPLTDEDCEVLLKSNQYTQRLNIISGQVVKDPSAVERLVAHKLIMPDGRMTDKGRKKYDELIYLRRVAMAGQKDDKSPDSDINATDTSEAELEPLSETDREALLSLDRTTGLLMKYKSGNGQLDASRLHVLSNGGVIQRFLSNGLITPEGKLTPKGIQECRRIEDQASNLRLAAVSWPLPAAADPSVTVEETDEAEERSKEPLRKVFADKGRFVWSTDTPSISKTAKEKDQKTDGAESRSEPAAIDSNLVSLLAPQSFMAERFKILRTNLLYPVGKDAPRSLLVTSVNPGDGKSFVAANLAVSVAMNINRYVLLMDCDLRKPTIHNTFGFGECPGLSEYLVQGVPLPSLLRRTRIDRLTILPGGAPPSNPSELLSSNHMAKLMKEVANRYPDRLIIIDSPPPSLTSETGVLARMAEGIIIVVRHLRTDREEMKALVNQFGKEKIVGSVLNYFEDSTMSTKGYRYYRKYGDYTYG